MTCRITKEALANYKVRASSGRVVVFDTETTGISHDDEIVQIAAAEYACGELTRTFNLYVIPSCCIRPEAEAVHHLTMQFLVENGTSPGEALDRFFGFLGRDALLVAHNIHFDFRMLQNECRKYDYVADPDELSYCDTMALAKKLVPGYEHYNLASLIKEMGLDGVNSHNALDDALACGALFFHLMQKIPTAGEYVYEPLCSEEEASDRF